MKNRVLSLRVPDNLMELVGLYGREERIDQATALRQWLYAGAEEYVVRMVEQGRISVTRAAELLDLSVYDIYRLAEAHGLTVSATGGEYESSRRTVDSAR